MDLSGHQYQRTLRLRDLPKVPRKHCRWCGRPCPGRRRHWCSDECVEEYMIRSHPSLVSKRVKKRDKGVCALCGRDTLTMRRLMLEFNRHMQRIDPRYRMGEEMGPWLVRGRRKMWDAHHIKPVSEGGGCCGLENYQTVCVRCHRDETRKLAGTRAQKRKHEHD